MAFLTLEDLTISDAEQTRLTTIQADVFTESFATAEAYLIDRLIHMYDMTAELSKTGPDRRTTLVKIGIKLATFEAYKVAPQINVPQIVDFSYQEAMQELNKIEKGGLLTNLTPQEDESQQIGVVRHGTTGNFETTY